MIHLDHVEVSLFLKRLDMLHLKTELFDLLLELMVDLSSVFWGGLVYRNCLLKLLVGFAEKILTCLVFFDEISCALANDFILGHEAIRLSEESVWSRPLIHHELILID